MNSPNIDKYVENLGIITKSRPMWSSIIQTRLLLGVLVIVFILLIPLESFDALIVTVILYLGFNFSLVLIPEIKLSRRKIRFLPDLSDIVFISAIIFFEGQNNRSWFLFYLFPIISVARYWGNNGSLLSAFLSIALYSIIFSIQTSNWQNDFPSFVLQCLCFIGIAVIAGNLTKYRQLNEINFIEALEEINNEILRSQNVDSVYEIILQKAMEITNSDMGHMRVVDENFNLKIVAKKIPSEISEVLSNELTNYYSKKAFETKKSVRISGFERGDSAKRRYFDSENIPKKALFVPLISNERGRKGVVIATLAIYSQNTFTHYSKVDEIRLKSFSRMVEIAERLKRSSELYLNRTMDKLQHPMIVINKKGFIINFNRGCERIWRISSEKAIGRNIKDFYISENEAKRLGELLFDKGQIKERATIKVKGKPVVINLSASLMRDDQDEPIGSLGIFEEIKDSEILKESHIPVVSEISDEIRQQAKQLIEEDRLKTIQSVFGFASHEIKNKLNASSYEIDSLRKQIKRKDLSKALKTLTRLEDSLTVATDKLKRLIQTKSSINISSHKETTFIENIFEKDFKYMRRSAITSEAQLTINTFPREKFQVVVDIDQMKTVFRNLLDNSIYALDLPKANDAREINIQVQSNKKYVLINWKDTGCGISEKDLDCVFEPRFTTKETHGTGLGLYWVKTIIDNHGGSIAVDSQEGQWTEFIIKLPLVSNSNKIGFARWLTKVFNFIKGINTK